MKITFLAHSVDHIGGTIRATLNTATALANRGHDVEIATVFKNRTKPLFTLDPRIKLTPLLDKTPFGNRAAKVTSLRDRFLQRKSSAVYPAGDTRSDGFNALTDLRVGNFLRVSDADIIVGTRPGLNVYVAQYAPRRAVTVAQEHLFYDHHKPELRAAMSHAYRRIDAIITVSEADANNYRNGMPHLRKKVSFIPNSIVPTPLEPSEGNNKLIVAAGRLSGSKRFGMLIKAFSQVHAQHPEWKLRIYGYGKRLVKLRRLAEKHHLGDAVSLMGQKTPLDPEWVKGSIAAMTSKYESFGMTLVEAMNCGLPVVSTACDYGPPEIITDGVDGFLTPVNDTDAFAAALSRLISDDEMRHRMAKAARVKAERYLPDAVSAQYEQLFNELVKQRDATPPHGLPMPLASPVARWHGLSNLPAQAATVAVKAPAHQTSVELAIDCVSTAFNDLTLRVRGPVVENHLELRGNDHEAVRVPLQRDGEGHFAHLDSETLRQLPEGTLTACHKGVPIAAGRIDSRQLMQPLTSTPSSVVVPFGDDPDGRLTLRVWRREAYAEVDTVQWRGDDIRISGRLLGTDWSDMTVTTLAQLRHSPQSEHFDTAIGEDGRFSVSIAANKLAAARFTKHDLWDLWLSDADQLHSPIRFARFFDDIAVRKPIQRFNASQYREVKRPGRVRPYFTVDNEFSIGIVDLASEVD